MDLTKKRIAILGAGNMGFALMRGLIDAGTPPKNIVISDKIRERTDSLAAEHGVDVASSNIACAQNADVILIAVKPQVFSDVTADLSGRIEAALVLSIAAGVRIERIERELTGVRESSPAHESDPASSGRGPRVIRAMPNTPALVKEGATAIAPGTHATPDDVLFAKEIFGAVGRVVVVDESLLDAVTGLSGSGPAYVFLMIEALSDAGVKVGLSRETATELAVQTVRGASTMMQVTKEHPARLKDQVTSPGGTTIAGLAALEEGGLRATIIRAVEAATRRAKELGTA